MPDVSAPLDRWVGRREVRDAVIAPGPAIRLAATLDRDDAPLVEGDPLPPGWHWLYFLSATRRSALGPDGHTARGGFLPPVDLPRRMWAGGRLRFLAPLAVGAPATRVSEIVSVAAKEGQSGRLVFVTVRHRISAEGVLAVEEAHDIVYREAPRPGTSAPPAPAPPAGPWRREVRPDPVLLFRFSALTFNAHRIHYDRAYATGIEGYPGLVVHGPLMAVLLLDLLCREAPEARLAAFDYRARAPLFDDAPFTVSGAPNGEGATLWAIGPDGGLAMEGAARFGPSPS